MLTGAVDSVDRDGYMSDSVKRSVMNSWRYRNSG